MDICHLKNAELEAKHQKYKGRAVLRGDIVERRFGLLCSIYRARSICITNDGCKSNGYHFKVTWNAQDKHADAISAYTQVKMEDAPKLVKNSTKKNCPDNMDTSTTTTNDRNLGPVWKTQSFLSSEICTVILWQDNLWERQFEKILYGSMAGRKFPISGIFICTP